jgi:hypothetical protein
MAQHFKILKIAKPDASPLSPDGQAAARIVEILLRLVPGRKEA